MTTMALGTYNKKFLSGGPGGKERSWEGKKVRRLKASKPFLHDNSNALYDTQHFAAFSANSIHLKKPSGGPKGLIGPPCHGADF
jgi:hypothetical protein